MCRELILDVVGNGLIGYVVTLLAKGNLDKNTSILDASHFGFLHF